MLLKAEELKISSSWCAISNENLIREILKIPEDISLEAIICFGHSAKKSKIAKRIDLNNLVHYEEW